MYDLQKKSRKIIPSICFPAALATANALMLGKTVAELNGEVELVIIGPYIPVFTSANELVTGVKEVAVGNEFDFALFCRNNALGVTAAAAG